MKALLLLSLLSLPLVASAASPTYLECKTYHWRWDSGKNKALEELKTFHAPLRANGDGSLTAQLEYPSAHWQVKVYVTYAAESESTLFTQSHFDGSGETRLRTEANWISQNFTAKDGSLHNHACTLK